MSHECLFAKSFRKSKAAFESKKMLMGLFG